MDLKELQAAIAVAVKAELDPFKAEIAKTFNPYGGEKGDPPPADKKWKSFGHFLGAVAVAETQGLDKAPSGLSEVVAGDGGFLVDQEFSTELLRLAHETGVLASRCRTIPIGAPFNGLRISAIDETSRANGSRLGGIRAYWASEAGTKTPSKPKFRKVAMDLEKLIGLCYATDELLADYAALGSVISMGFGEEFGFKMDDALVNGDGAGKPLGILAAPCLVSVPKESGQPADTVVTENIVRMWSRMWSRSRPNAVWFINQDIEPQLFTMSLSVGTGGIPVYMPANGLSDSPYGRLMGRPVIPLEQCGTLGDVGDIILADYSQYLLIDKGAMDSASSIHVKFVTDETAFRFVYRVNGQPWWNAPLTPFKGTATKSPFVTLAAR